MAAVAKRLDVQPEPGNPYLWSDAYPPDAAGGACYLSKQPQRQDYKRDAGGNPVPERILITGHLIVGEGSLCIGQSAIDGIAHALGMLYPDEVKALKDEVKALKDARKSLVDAVVSAAATFDG